MRNYRVYGNENTHLSLSAKAQSVYDNTDPLKIHEFENDGVYSYNVIGAFERYAMTEQEVNDFLESFCED